MPSAAPEILGGAQGARRQVTAMFVDLVGFSEFASTADAEDLQAWLDDFYDRARAVIEAGGGEVTEFLGDGVIGVFGLARAQELAARRAVEVATQIVGMRDLAFPGGHPVRLRGGVATGEVATRRPGHRDRALPRMTGMVTTLAQRLQSVAAPGEVLIAAETGDLLRGAIPLVPRPDTRLKGFPAPLTVYLVDTRAQHDRSERTTRKRHFVGRRAEIARIARSDRPCLVVGQAGIGKSALAETFLHSDRRDIRLHADPIKSRDSYHPFVDWLRSLTGRDRPDFAALCACFPAMEPDHRQALALILGLPEGQALPARFASTTLSARIDTALMIAIRDKLGDGALLIEDLHWLDNASFGAIRLLIASLRSQSCRVLMTSRESVKIDRNLSDLSLEIVPLGGLNADDATEYLEHHAFSGISDETRADLIRHAGGVPLYLEQMLKYGAAQALPMTTIPATLSDLLNERIDGSGDARPVLLQASVLGRSFSLRLLENLAAPARDVADRLEQSAKAGLVEKVGKDEWSFTHALLHLAAYRQLLRGAREALHGRVAELLQGQCASQADGGPAVLAGHQSRARLFLPAARSYLEASRIAMMQGAFSDAEDHARAALDMVGEATGTRGARGLEIAAQTALGSILIQTQGFAAPDVRAAYDSVLQIATTRTSDPAHVPALFGSYSNSIIAGNRSRADELRDLLIAAADKAETSQASQSDEYRLAADAAANCGYFYSGEFARQWPHLARIRETYRLATHAPMIAHYGMDIFAAAQMFELPARTICGEIDRLDDLLAETDAHQQALSIPVMQPYALIWGAVPLFHGGRGSEARARLDRGLAAAADQGAVFWQLIGQCWRHVMDPDLSATEQGRKGFVEAIETLRGIGALIALPYFTTHAALALARAGRPRDALVISREAVREGAASRLLCWQAETLRIHAEINRLSGRSEAAGRLLGQAIDLAREQGATLWQLRAAADLAALNGGEATELDRAIVTFGGAEKAAPILSACH